MALHYFHCSDGADLLIDRTGRDLALGRSVSHDAVETAEALIERLPAYDDWEKWSVYVYDQFGEVGIVPFPTRQRMAA